MKKHMLIGKTKDKMSNKKSFLNNNFNHYIKNLNNVQKLDVLDSESFFSLNMKCTNQKFETQKIHLNKLENK